MLGKVLLASGAIVFVLFKSKENLEVLETLRRENFKTESAFIAFEQLDPRLKKVLLDVKTWCSKKNIPLVITETKTTKTTDEDLNRVSTTHQEGRAADIRVTGAFTIPQIDEFLHYFNNVYEFRNYGALSKGDNKRRLAVYEDASVGRIPHLHIQVSK